MTISIKFGKNCENFFLSSDNLTEVNSISFIHQLSFCKSSMKLSSTSKREAYSRFKLLPMKNLIKYLKWTSCLFAVMGGVLLASRTVFSGYGFIFLAMSSSHMLIASWLIGDQSMICYSGSIFLFVDCFGVYRWLLS